MVFGLLWKFIVIQLKKFPAFMELLRFVTMVTKTRPCAVSISQPHILLMYSWSIKIKFLYAFIIFPVHATCPTHLLALIANKNIRWNVQIMKLLIMQYFILLLQQYFILTREYFLYLGIKLIYNAEVISFGMFHVNKTDFSEIWY